MILGFLPGGHVIDGFLNYRSSLKQKRMIQFSNSLKIIFEKELGESIDEYNFETEDFVDIIDSIFNKVLNTKSEKKLDRFKAIIVNQIKSNSDLAQVFIDLITKLNDIEVDILYSFQNSGELKVERLNNMDELNAQHKEKLSYVERLKKLAIEGELKQGQSILKAEKDAEIVFSKQMKEEKDYEE